MTPNEIKSFLDEKVELYNNPNFIESDPIQIPHQFSVKEDIEIAGFLTATIAWGNRKSIINNANRMMQFLANSPYDFVLNHQESDLHALEPFVHRTFNSEDFKTFIKALQHIYINHNGLEMAFAKNQTPLSMQQSIAEFKKLFFEVSHQPRTMKHVSDPMQGSAAKRINMFLRWMVRQDQAGVDFGIWNKIKPSELICPIDLHVARVAKRFQLLDRTNIDWQAGLELTQYLKTLDPKDPVKYDFALFGLGVIEKYV